MSEETPLVELEKDIIGGDFQRAGDVSSELKDILQRAGFPPYFNRRVVIASYEAEMNVVIHAYRGVFRAKIYSDRVHVEIDDQGPGILDLELAFREGYSTAPPHIREMGFGAGYGLSNMKKCSDVLSIDTRIGEGTKVVMDFVLSS